MQKMVAEELFGKQFMVLLPNSANRFMWSFLYNVMANFVTQIPLFKTKDNTLSAVFNFQSLGFSTNSSLNLHFCAFEYIIDKAAW